MPCSKEWILTKAMKLTTLNSWLPPWMRRKFSAVINCRLHSGCLTRTEEGPFLQMKSNKFFLLGNISMRNLFNRSSNRLIRMEMDISIEKNCKALWVRRNLAKKSGKTFFNHLILIKIKKFHNKNLWIIFQLIRINQKRKNDLI